MKKYFEALRILLYKELAKLASMIMIEKSLYSNKQNKGKTFQDFCRMYPKGLGGQWFYTYFTRTCKNRSCFVFIKMFFLSIEYIKPEEGLHTYKVWKVCLLVNHFWGSQKLYWVLPVKYLGKISHNLPINFSQLLWWPKISQKWHLFRMSLKNLLHGNLNLITHSIIWFA